MVYAYILQQISYLQQLGITANTRKAQFWQYMRIFCKYHIRNKSATNWHHVQIHKKATSLQHIGNRWLRGICSPATGAKICAKTFICLYAKMAKMSDFSNHNIFAYMLASCANLNFHPVSNTAAWIDLLFWIVLAISWIVRINCVTVDHFALNPCCTFARIACCSKCFIICLWIICSSQDFWWYAGSWNRSVLCGIWFRTILMHTTHISMFPFRWCKSTIDGGLKNCCQHRANFRCVFFKKPRGYLIWATCFMWFQGL